MYETTFDQFAPALKRLGSQGQHAPEFSLGKDGPYELRYIPFEYLNRDARLVIVGITPGPNQIELAYDAAQSLLLGGAGREQVLAAVKKTGSFGGPAMRPNLLRMLRHFPFNRLLGIEDVATLWSTDANLLHSTSVVPHAVFENGKPFNGKFDAILKSPLLKQCLLDSFVASIAQLRSDALYVALGDTPNAALKWCVSQGYLGAQQVLGAFCHPSSSGGSATAYYLRERTRAELAEKDPVRHRAPVLDEYYRHMHSSISALLGSSERVAEPVPASIPRPAAPPSTPVPVAEVVGKAKGPRRSAPREAEPDDEARAQEIRSILDQVTAAGNTLTHEVKKVAELQTRSGEVVYLIKDRSRMNRIVLAVHPEHAPERLSRLPGVESVSSDHRFHANMSRFPKKKKNGEKETQYGWHVITESLGDCQRFLASF
jgi:hypothetical protein